jgi:hypothetical protein
MADTVLSGIALDHSVGDVAVNAGHGEALLDEVAPGLRGGGLAGHAA